MKIVAICLLLLLLAGTCAAYTRGAAQNPGHGSTPEFNLMQDKLFLWQGYYHSLEEIVIMMRAQQGAKMLGHGLGQKVARLGATS